MDRARGICRGAWEEVAVCSVCSDVSSFHLFMSNNPVSVLFFCLGECYMSVFFRNALSIHTATDARAGPRTICLLLKPPTHVCPAQ
jgi:hypothetical protein